jgi:hypothetical protein
VLATLAELGKILASHNVQDLPGIMMFFLSLLAVVCGVCSGFSNNACGAPSRARALMMQAGDSDPLLLRAARGEEIERVPVWMMRQAGRHLQVRSSKRLLRRRRSVF